MSVTSWLVDRVIQYAAVEVSVRRCLHVVSSEVKRSMFLGAECLYSTTKRMMEDCGLLVNHFVTKKISLHNVGFIFPDSIYCWGNNLDGQ